MPAKARWKVQAQEQEQEQEQVKVREQLQVGVRATVISTGTVAGVWRNTYSGAGAC